MGNELVEFEGTRYLWKSFSENRYLWKVVAGVAAAVVAVRLYGKVKRDAQTKAFREASRGKVILHQVNRGKHSPSASSFSIKLETFLRMAEIPYEVDTTVPRGPHGKFPWMTVDGVEVPDSQLCIEYLSKHPSFKRNFPDKWLTPEQVAQSRALSALMEDRLFWGLMIWRYVYAKNTTQIARILNWFPESEFRSRMMLRQLKTVYFNYGWAHGIGRHSEKDIVEIALSDLKALSVLLGKKNFFLGDKPASIDCSAFGLILQAVWNCPKSPFEVAVRGELNNLRDYCVRMKKLFWSDWKQLGLEEPE